MNNRSLFVVGAESLGLALTGRSGDEAIGMCPSCLKEKHVYLNSVTGLWDCKRCGKSGNYPQLLDLLHRLHISEFTKDRRKKLAEDRGLPEEAFAGYDIGFFDGRYLIRVCDSNGRLTDIRQYRPGRKLQSTAGAKTGLFCAERLAATDAAKESVYVCEGEWDCIALSWLLRKLKLPGVCVGVPGANTFKDEWVPWFPGRVVTFLYDHDKAGIDGQERAAQKLSAAASKVSLLNWPKDSAEGADIRDLVVDAYGAGRSDREPQRLRDCWKKIQKHFVPFVPGKGSKKRIQFCPLIRGKGLDPHLCADALLNTHFMHDGARTLQFFRANWWEWTGRCYRRVISEEFVARVNRLLRKTLDQYELEDNRLLTGTVSNVVQAMSGICFVPDGDLPLWIGPSPKPGKGDLLAMENGLLDLEAALDGRGKAALLKHTPYHFSLVNWPFPYDPTAKCPRWEKFLNEVLEGNRALIAFLQEYLGYLLTFDTKMQVFLILHGDGANGKSVIIEVFTHVLGQDNVTHIGLERFGDRFELARTIGKLANLAGEVSTSRGPELGILKAIVSGDRIRVEFKNQTSFDAKPTIRLLFATNHLPRFDDSSDGIWRRMKVIPFFFQVPEEQQDPMLAERICKEELTGIFNWALEGLIRLRRQGGFTKSTKVEEAVRAHRTECSPVLQFLSENYVEDPHAKVKANAVWVKLKTHFSLEGKLPVSREMLGREVRRVFPNVTRVQLRQGGSREYYYRGLKSRS